MEPQKRVDTTKNVHCETSQKNIYIYIYGAAKAGRYNKIKCAMSRDNYYTKINGTHPIRTALAS